MSVLNHMAMMFGHAALCCQLEKLILYPDPITSSMASNIHICVLPRPLWTHSFLMAQQMDTRIDGINLAPQLM